LTVLSNLHGKLAVAISAFVPIGFLPDSENSGRHPSTMPTSGGAVMSLPVQTRLAAVALALAIAAAPALPESPRRRPAGKIEGTAVGLPIVTSDGKTMGKVVATGTDEDNRPVLVGEVERSLGLGPEAIAIPTNLFVRKPGRIELTIDAAEIDARLGRAERQR
jgi:hypothetical protein